MDGIFSRENDANHFETTTENAYGRNSLTNQVPVASIAQQQKIADENGQSTSQFGGALSRSNFQNDEQVCSEQLYDNSCASLVFQRISSQIENSPENSDDAALGPHATPPYEPMQEDIEPTTSCAPNSISTSLSQEQLQQFAVTQSLESEEKTSENSLGSGVGSSNERHVNFMHNVETPEAIQTQVEYPEVSEITQYLAKKLKSNVNQYAAVFYHQYNVDQKNIHENNLEQHDLQWENSSFVRTVFSAKNILLNYHGSISKWAKIKRSLTDLVRHCTKGALSENADMLMRNALSRYDSSLQRRTDLMTLTHPDIKMCFATTIPTIVQHALKLPSLLAAPIPFLKADQNQTIFTTKKLVSSLLANAFFCTLPDEKEDMIDINFHRMFNTPARGQAKTEKLKCILNYFQQLGPPGKNPEKENQIISFERRVIHDKVNWASSSAKLTSVQVEPTKKIEEALGTLQVDFANKRVGGGVLNEGAVMEEILFAVCPELIISRLFTETLEDDEVLIISGTEQFSNYEGYGRSFHYAGPTKPINFEVDNLGRIRTQIVVMDALHFKPHEIESQFEREKIDRELHKAFVAFVIPNGETDIPIATGNWGCGAFNGDLELKFLIQWMAASEAGRGLVLYHTIGDAMQTQAIKFMEAYLRKKNASNGELYKAIVSYQKRMTRFCSVFDYVRSFFNNKM